jgi:hypothetical protein
MTCGSFAMTVGHSPYVKATVSFIKWFTISFTIMSASTRWQRRSQGWRGSTAAWHRGAVSLGCKRALQILEFFDHIGLTGRVRDGHVLRSDGDWKVACIDEAARLRFLRGRYSYPVVRLGFKPSLGASVASW